MLSFDLSVHGRGDTIKGHLITTVFKQTVLKLLYWSL